jgi:hypothetical protein
MDAISLDARNAASRARTVPENKIPSMRTRPVLMPSAASLALGAAGGRQVDVARMLGCSQSRVSLIFGGARPVPDGLAEVLVGLVGAAEAERVLAAIPRRARGP